MKEFKNFVVDKCKELGILDMENIYFSQTRDMYYADYKPNYPEKTNGDFTITREAPPERTSAFSLRTKEPAVD